MTIDVVLWLLILGPFFVFCLSVVHKIDRFDDRFKGARKIGLPAWESSKYQDMARKDQ